MKALTIVSLIFTTTYLSAQTVITLKNPSLEGIHQAGVVPSDWLGCGFPNTSPGDTQPGSFNVKTKPYHGKSYLGLVIRENDTYEGVSQALSEKMEAGKCYQFSMYLARSANYWSITADYSAGEINFSGAATLRIYGSKNFCNGYELLAQSDAIVDTEWKKFQFILHPSKDYTHIMLEAYYKVPTMFPYNGNLLIDHLSEVKMLDCERVRDYLDKKAAVEAVKQKQDSVKIANYMRVEKMVKRHWGKVLYQKKAKDLTLEAKETLLAIFGHARQYKMDKIMLGIHENDKYFKKKLAALERFIASCDLPIGYVGVFPVKNSHPVHFWMSRNKSFYIKVR